MVSGSTFAQFFAWSPVVVGAVIYAGFYAAKRHEATTSGVPIGQSYACASCGRRGARDHMLPYEHEGAVSWFCQRCASSR